MRNLKESPASRRVPMAPLFEGVALGAAVAHRDLVMVPLVGDDRPGPAYMLLRDAMKADMASVREVSEGGSVPDLMVENRSDLPLLAMDGEELVGARQNRVLNLSLLLPPRSKTVVPVSCVEQGRWRYESRDFRPSRNVFFASGKMGKAMSVTRSLHAEGSRFSDQGKVWEDVGMKLQSFRKSSRTGAMSDAFETVDADLDGFRTALRPVAGQRGVLFFVHGALAGLELVDRAATHASLHDGLVSSYAMDALDNALAASAPVGKLEGNAFLARLKDLEADAFPSVGLGEDWRLDHPDALVAALVVDGVLLHGSVFPGARAAASQRRMEW